VAAALVLVSFAAAAHAERFTGRVVGIQDGDTLTLLDANRREQRVRLAGIDAPEARQRYGQAAKRELSDLAFGKQASADCPKTDRYGRRVCNVSVEGRDVGLALVQAGAAWHFRAYAQEQSPADRARYARAEEAARTLKAGLWADPEAVPPWDWRRGVRVPN
jgi:endonuclease YncB( thermonuclease family)